MCHSVYIIQLLIKKKRRRKKRDWYRDNEFDLSNGSCLHLDSECWGMGMGCGEARFLCHWLKFFYACFFFFIFFFFHSFFLSFQFCLLACLLVCLSKAIFPSPTHVQEGIYAWTWPDSFLYFSVDLTFSYTKASSVYTWINNYLAWLDEYWNRTVLNIMCEHMGMPLLWAINLTTPNYTYVCRVKGQGVHVGRKLTDHVCISVYMGICVCLSVSFCFYLCLLPDLSVCLG